MTAYAFAAAAHIAAGRARREADELYELQPTDEHRRARVAAHVAEQRAKLAAVAAMRASVAEVLLSNPFPRNLR